MAFEEEKICTFLTVVVFYGCQDKNSQRRMNNGICLSMMMKMIIIEDVNKEGKGQGHLQKKKIGEELLTFLEGHSNCHSYFRCIV